jgi:hypothetical protein
LFTGAFVDPNGTLVSDFVDLLDAVTSCAVTGVTAVPSAALTSDDAEQGAYATGEDKAIMIFTSDATGRKYKFQIPSPDEAIFKADKETVDEGNSDVIAFVAAIHANCKDTGGNALTFVRGYRKRVKRLNRKYRA